MNSFDITMTSYFLYNFIAINLDEVTRFSNLVLNLKSLAKSFPKMYYLSISINGMESYDQSVFFYCNHIPMMSMSRDICL